MAKHMFYSQFFRKVKPENITGLLLASLHQPDICYIKRGSHSCLVQANKNKTKNQTDWSRLSTFFKPLWQRLVQDHHLFFLLIRSAPVLFCFQKEQFMLLHIQTTWGSTQMETEWTSKMKRRTKAQTYLKLRLLSKVYCCLSPVLLVSYRDQKERQYLFLQLNREKSLINF